MKNQKNYGTVYVCENVSFKSVIIDIVERLLLYQISDNNVPIPLV